MTRDELEKKMRKIRQEVVTKGEKLSQKEWVMSHETFELLLSNHPYRSAGFEYDPIDKENHLLRSDVTFENIPIIINSTIPYSGKYQIELATKNEKEIPSLEQVLKEAEEI